MLKQPSRMSHPSCSHTGAFQETSFFPHQSFFPPPAQRVCPRLTSTQLSPGVYLDSPWLHLTLLRLAVDLRESPAAAPGLPFSLVEHRELAVLHANLVVML